MKKMILVAICVLSFGLAGLSYVMAAAELEEGGAKDPHEHLSNGHVDCWQIQSTCMNNEN